MSEIVADSPVLVPPAPAVPHPRRLGSICLYTPSTDPSGMGAHMLDLAAHCATHAEVTVMCRPTDGGRRVLAEAATLGATTVALPPPRDAAFARLISAFLRSRPADVFHCHVGLGWENWGGVRAARTAGVPVVVQTQHLPFLLAHPRKRHGLLRAVAEVDRVITVSDGQRRTYERAGVRPDGLTTIPNGVRPRPQGHGRARARAMLGLDPDRPVVMTVGRLTHMKAQRHLVDALPEVLRRFPWAVLVIVGDGPLRARLAEQAAALGVADAVRLVGRRADARLLLDAADVFVLPSRHEGMPLALLEAMDAGLPVVATRVVGSADVVEDGRTGVLVPAGSSPALAAAIGNLLADPELRRRYGSAGRRSFLQRFTAERMAAETVALYEELLRTAQPAGRCPA